MVLRRLRYFAAVADEGSLKRAASKLRLAQPAISRQMRALEEELATPLFMRGRRGVELTPAGMALLAGIREIVARLGLAVRQARLAHDGRVGTLRMGLSRAAIDSRQVGAGILALRALYPDVDFVVSESAIFEQAHALRSGELHMAIGYIDHRDKAIRSHALFDDVLDGAMLSTSHPLAVLTSPPPHLTTSPPLSVSDLAQLPCFVIAQSIQLYPDLFDQLQRLGVAWDAVESSETVFANVAAGLGWTPCPSSAKITPPFGTTVRRIRGLNVALTMMLHWRASETSRLVDNVVNAMTSSDAVVARRRTGRPTPPRLAVQQRPEDALPIGLELNQLRTFIATLDERSLSRAASILGLTQSGVSRQLRALERELGVILLERAAHGVIPTVAGQVFEADATAVLSLVDAAIARARRAAKGHSEYCVIGTVPIELTSGLVTHALKQTAADFPGLEVELREMVTTVQEIALRQGLIDIGIAGRLSTHIDDPALASVQLLDDPIECALLAKSHPLAGRSFVNVAELGKYQFNFVSRDLAPRLYDTVTQAFVDLGLILSTANANSSTRALWRNVADTTGWTPAPRSQHLAPPAGLVAIPVEGLSIPWGLRLIWRREGASPAARSLLEVFRRRGNA